MKTILRDVVKWIKLNINKLLPAFEDYFFCGEWSLLEVQSHIGVIFVLEILLGLEAGWSL